MASTIELPKLSTPAGGGAVRGMGESYAADDFTGAATFRIPVPASECREVTPQLVLGYTSGGSNGAFGLGFELALPRISRRTDAGIPRYDDSDEFIADGEVLVPALEQAGDQWRPIVSPRSAHGIDYEVRRYRKRVDGDGTRFERWRRLSDNDEHWRIASADGSVAVLGADPAARIADPDAPARVLSWLIEYSLTALGDRVEYRYKAEDGDNIPSVPSNAGRDHRANRYIAEIRYGAYDDGQGGLAYAMRVVFDYGEYDISAANPDPYAPVRTWPARPDPFSSYRSGFEIRTYRLCRGVLMFHALPELGAQPCLVAATVLSHTVQDGLSVLDRAVQRGYRHDDAGCTMLEVPGIALDYQPFEPARQSFQPVAPARGSFPAPLSQGELIVADLLGEGLPGLLFSTPSACQFWRNLGDGRFAAALTPQAMPVQRDVSSGRQLLTSLQGNGQLDCVVAESGQAGYYRYRRNSGWSAFQAFPQWAPESATAAAQYVDLSGSGLTDLLVMQDASLRWYPGRGEEGYGEPVELVLEAGVPDPRSSSQTELVDFADLIGDGGAHIVRIRDGSVECWPSLGYGRFGARVLFDAAPVFPGGFDASRLRLADISGSGGADLIYFGERQAHVYLNLAGDGFAEPVTVELPAAYSQLSYAGSADLLGGGSHDLLLGTATQGQWLIDFTGGRKPWLLCAVRNDLGASTELTYASSSRFALDDALAGRPWPCTLPFPVQVLTRVVRTEPFSDARDTLRLAYHDGYYDPVAQSFRGFGQVERWTEQTVDGQAFAPTAHTRTWYATGAFVDGDLLTLQYLRDYWHGEAGRQPAPPDSAIRTLEAPPDAALLRVAQRALKGQVLRSESYGLDGGPQEDRPFTVIGNSYTLDEVQPGSGDHDAVFQVSARETVTAVYERDAQDPRISQQFTLEVDAYGHVLLAVEVANRRGNTSNGVPATAWPAFQTEALATARQSTFAAPLEHGDAFIVPALEDIAYQLGQVAPTAGGWLDFDTVLARTRTALQHVIPPEQAFSGAQPQARLRLDSRQIYWDAAQAQALPFGNVAWPGLLHHALATRMSIGMVAQTYGDRLSAEQLQDEGFLQRDGDFWWAPGDITRYTDATGFHRPVSATDAAGNSVSVGYDPYALLPVSITNADGTARAVPDYQTLQATTLTDVNGVVDQVLPDALGRVVVATRFHAPAGGTRQGDGDLSGYVPRTATGIDEVLADPAAYLQQMTGYFYYDYGIGSEQPPVVLSVARQLHVSQLTSGQSSRLKLVTSYSDALGRGLETRTRVEAAACGQEQDAWVCNDQVQLDVQGQAVKRWLPRFGDTAAFTGDRGQWYDTDWRDAQGRVVETLTAKGFIARNVYRAWTGEQWDLDDTVPTSPYYLAHIGDTSPEFADERRALEQAAFFADTYLTQWLDPLGRVVDLEQRNRSTDAPQVQSMVTASVLDLDGRTLALADPRFSARNAAGDPPVWNIVSGYDLAGNTMSLDSMDSGTRVAFNDALGRLVHQWDGRGVHSRRDYDAMNRITGIYVDGALGLQQVVERLSYGTDAATNSIGRRVELRDASGVLSEGPFDLGGKPVSSRFQLRVDYVDEVDWSPGKTVALEPARTTLSERNAFEQLIDKTCADGSRQRNDYYAIGWMASADLTLAGATAPSQVLAQAVYSPEGKRASAQLGSDLLAVRRYEDSTGRLLGIDTSRRGDGKALQRIAYTYDPVGNVTCAEDATVPLVFCNQSQIGPRQDYGYDAIYRLRQASGRENPAIGADSYRTGFKQSVYIPLCPDNPTDATKLVPYQESYRYDDSGNLTLLEHTTPESGLSWTRRYSVSESSNRVVLDDGDGSGADPDAAYDANGNMVDFEHLRSMDWDWRNKPHRAVTIARSGDDDDAQYYVYNSAGQRVRRVTQRLTAGGLQVEDKVYLDGCELVRELPASGPPEVVRTGISVGEGGGRLLMAYHWPASDGRSPQWRFQLATVTGSAALEVEADGSVISYEEYFPYGGTAIIAGNSQTEVELKDYRFCGKECDATTGLYFFGDRYYVTWLARWLSPDPNGPVDSPNLYQYVGCNPLSYVDPSGGCRAKINVPPSGTTTAFSTFESNYRYLSQSESDAYQQLAQDINDYVYKYNSEATGSYDARLSPQLEYRVLSMFEKFKPLHIASNPELLSVFRTAQGNAGVDDDTGGIKSYTKMRSPYFTRAMNDTEMGDIVASDDFYRTVELHHGAKKQFLPEYATSASNLWALSRGGSSYGVVGQHEGAFHTVGAAKFGNIYTTELPAYTGLLLHWQGLRTLKGDDPMDAFKPPPPQPVFTTQPLLPSFSTLLSSIPQSSFTQPVVQGYAPPQQPMLLWSPQPSPTFFPNQSGGHGYPSTNLY
ncbi:hypothetical protein FKV24_006005 [Lysobacter maris]|uniref:Toxin n=1 Tax=Marilutibacter maris TaxID=1605891 RepID=A0A508B180_9GAMM|nr:SpvB/TcaC N-terminal domain-containing protein [Lysobacter maris]KAB8194366.1 hypothetical protein FKV24_006005 [Lysobacter maris]